MKNEEKYNEIAKRVGAEFQELKSDCQERIKSFEKKHQARVIILSNDDWSVLIKG